MKKNNRTLWIILCVVLVAAIVCAVVLLTRPQTQGTGNETAVQQTGETKDALARLKEKGRLVIGTEGNWSPWTYHDDTDKLTGFDVEIGRLIAEKLGVEADFQEAPWDSLLAGVDAERFDIICNGVGFTEERAKSYSFTIPYGYTNQVLVVAEDNGDILTVDDLKGKKTANSASSTYAALAESYGAELVPVDTLGETVDLLQQGRVDATLNSQVSIGDYLKEHPEAKIKVVQVLPGEAVAYPLKKGEDTKTLVETIDGILKAAMEDGTIGKLSMQFFGVDITKAE